MDSEQSKSSSSSSSIKPKFDWYETNTDVVVGVMIKKINPEKVHVDFEPRRMIFRYPNEPIETSGPGLINDNQAAAAAAADHNYELILNLNGEIVPSECTWKTTSVKAEIKMKKSALNIRWEKLEMADNGKCSNLIQPMNSSSSSSSDQSKTSSTAATTTTEETTKSSLNTTKWDDLVKQVEKDEEQDQGVEELFRRIYAQGDENLRRAMNKSFVESNGTVLSTNWSEVGKGQVECKPPASSEYKKWNS